LLEEKLIVDLAEPKLKRSTAAHRAEDTEPASVIAKQSTPSRRCMRIHQAVRPVHTVTAPDQDTNVEKDGHLWSRMQINGLIGFILILPIRTPSGTDACCFWENIRSAPCDRG
jgi:hypothetical protein